MAQGQASSGLSVGGGIGGLTAALSLLAAGFDVHVYEQASRLGEVGAGVQVSPNASRILHRVGLLRSPLAEPLEATFGFPHYQMHRADLLFALAGGVPAERVHLGHRLTSLEDRGTRSRRGSPTAPRSRSTCWWEPTASTRRSAASCSDPTSPASPAVSPIAGWSRPTCSATWRWR
jgi:monoamine oxidase